MAFTVTGAEPVIQGCIESCRRLLLVLGAVTPEQFRARWNNHNAIGPHTRHCIEHLTALRAGLDTGLVDYDARERNRHLEEDPLASMDAVRALAAWLGQLDPALLDVPLTVAQIPRIDTPPTQAGSSLRRELLFVTSHTVHHLALVSMLAELQGIALPESIGVAYSTTTYEHTLARHGSAAPS